MSHGQDQLSPSMQQAVQLLKEGKAADAEALLARAARDAEARFGRGSPAYAIAQNDLGNLHSHFGDLKRAAAAYRLACDGPLPADTQARRDRLTYLVNLAGTLEGLGDLDGAERAHRDSVAGRREFYGADHPGYAFGLEPLAALLLRRGKAQEALPALNEAVDILWQNGHPRVASALALRAEAFKALGDPAPPFAGLQNLPDNLVTELANTALERSRKTDPVWARQVLADVLTLFDERFGPDHRYTLNVLAAVANHEADMGERGDHAIRLRAIRRALRAFDRLGRDDEALHALQGLAVALGQAGQNDEAVAAYQDALGRALEAGNRAVGSQVRRNYGLFLAELNRPEGAEQQLRAALADGEAAQDAERWGRAEASLGIFLMHQNRAAEAGPLLEAALRRLDPAHPDTVYARHHLNALQAGQPCNCGDSWEALAEQLRAYVLRQVPEGLLADLQLRFEDGDVKVGAYLAREATPEELERLQIVLNQAVYTFKERVSRRT
jgi:tetratricopeptide (TPR) repeat protein